jgi:Spy/CpxP family protein refolding chaperone
MNALLKWKVALYLTAIFAAGSITGWMVGTKSTKEKMLSPQLPEQIGTRLREDLNKQLSLSADQKTKVDAIMEQNSKDMKIQFDANLLRIRQLGSNRDAQIVSVLTPAQKEKFDDLEKKRMSSSSQDRRGRTWRRGGPGPESSRPQGPNVPPMWGRGGPPTNGRPNFRSPWEQGPSNPMPPMNQSSNQAKPTP